VTEGSLDGKAIVITGASSGLGEAFARMAAAEGAAVMLGARRLERLRTVATEIRAAGGTAEQLAVDVRHPAQVKALAEEALARFGRIDVWINNAGVMRLSALRKCLLAEWNDMVDVNLRGVLAGVAAALPSMIERKSGHIVNVASVAAHKVGPGGAVYSATKSAVAAISEGLRLELKAFNIRSTLISPGQVHTELVDGVLDEDFHGLAREAYKQALQPEAVARAMLYAITQPPDVDVNEIVVRPVSQAF
jgi:NADP-dependent 3-hydroxy acid dehydrogenase YdfG